MQRTFICHRVRETESLDGFWDFATLPGGRAPDRVVRRVPVPAAWETLPGLESYRGRARYRRSVRARPGLALRFVFGGASHTATARLDGRRIGGHYDAFTAWTALATAAPGEHEVTVDVDNSFGERSALHLPNDYMTYGGLTRPVELHHVPEVFIERLDATPRRDGGRWRLETAVVLRNRSGRARSRRLAVSVAGRTIEARATVPGRGSRVVRGAVRGLDVQPWSARTPRLYEVSAVLSDGAAAVDDLIDRVGFREIAVRGRGLRLNGRPLRLRGYNRHEDHGQFGCALPLEAMVRDLEILRDLGCNFVRTSHYPNDPRFLDLCDEMGFYVWEESHARQVRFDHPRFREQIETSTREMIEQHRNHPCIVIWGCLNECETRTAAGRAEHARVIRQIRRLDGRRPVTYASMYHERDTAFGLADIVSVNIYTGWYHDPPDRIAPRLRAFLRWLHSPRSRGGRGKPVILSEFGGAGLYGCRHPARMRWTEEYQSDLLDEALRVYLNHPDVGGAAIWQFADCRITKEGSYWSTRPRGYNNKGSVDEFRRRKLACETVRRRMLEARRKWEGGDTAA